MRETQHDALVVTVRDALDVRQLELNHSREARERARDELGRVRDEERVDQVHGAHPEAHLLNVIDERAHHTNVRVEFDLTRAWCDAEARAKNECARRRERKLISEFKITQRMSVRALTRTRIDN